MEGITTPEISSISSLKENGDFGTSRILEQLKNWSKSQRKALRNKYFIRFTKNDKPVSKCKAMIEKPDGTKMECGCEYSTPSSTTELEHLATHYNFSEFKNMSPVAQKKLDSFFENKKETIPTFKTVALLYLLESNISWNSFDSEWWKILVTKYVNKNLLVLKLRKVT